MAAVAALVTVAALVGLGLGTELGRARHGVAWRTGDARVGEQLLTAVADGTSWGASGSVRWIERRGIEHERGWPTCLAEPGAHRVRFAGTQVPLAGGSSYVVVAVDCRATVRTGP